MRYAAKATAVTVRPFSGATAYQVLPRHSHRFIFIAIAEIHDIAGLKRGVKGRHEKL